jgi:hypothetical protein
MQRRIKSKSMQTIDEFSGSPPTTVTEEGGSRVIENFDNVASVLAATPDQDWNLGLGSNFLIFMVSTALMAAGVATTLVLAPHLVAIPAAIGGTSQHVT